MARGITTKVVWAIAIVVVATTATKAFGFYFLGWPAGPKVPASLLTPSADGHNPPGQGISPGPTGSSNPNPASGPSSPSDPTAAGPPSLPGSGPEPTAPEPGTLVLAAVGLGLAGLIRARRKGRQGTKSEEVSPPCKEK